MQDAAVSREFEAHRSVVVLRLSGATGAVEPVLLWTTVKKTSYYVQIFKKLFANRIKDSAA